VRLFEPLFGQLSLIPTHHPPQLALLRPTPGKYLTFDVELMSLIQAAGAQTIVFGAGCFWGPQLLFDRVPGASRIQGLGVRHRIMTASAPVNTTSVGRARCVEGLSLVVIACADFRLRPSSLMAKNLEDCRAGLHFALSSLELCMRRPDIVAPFQHVACMRPKV
jgi:hypothetical protein